MIDIQSLDPHNYFVIDTTTGTVVDVDGLVLVPAPQDDDIMEALVSDSDSAAEYAQNHGIPLYAREDDLTD